LPFANCLVLLCLLLIGTHSLALPSGLENNISKQASIDIKNSQYVIEDNIVYDYGGVLELDDSLWQPAKSFPLNLGVLPKGAWLRFELKNVEAVDVERFLEVPNPSLHHLSIYIKSANQPDQKWLLGSSLPFLERPIMSRNFTVPITIASKQTIRVYLRAESRVGVLIPVRLHTSAKFWQLTIAENMYHGFYFGILFMFVAFNLGLYLFRNDILHLLLSVDLAVFCLMYGNHLGLNFEYLWPIDPDFNYLASLFFSYLMVLTANIFSWRFIQLKSAYGHIPKVFYYCFNISASLGLILLWFIPIAWSSYFCASVGLLVAYYLAYLCYLSYRERASYAGCYLASYSLSAIATSIYVLHKLALLPTNLVVTNFLGYSILLQALVLTSVMIERKKKARKILGFQDPTQLIPHSVRDWVAQFSHEIRTPLNGIIGMADLLKETPLNPTQYNYVRSLSLSGEHLVDLVSDILDYESLASGQVQLFDSDFNLAELCQQSCDSLARMADENDVSIALEYEQGMPLDFYGDSKRFRQILLNLLNNAIKFAEGGRVVISLGYSSAGELQLKVWDNGIGMTRQQQKEVFKRFRQADGSVYQKFGGNGLGLAICEQLASLMSGSISVDSEVNSFCCFTLVLPIEVASRGDTTELVKAESALFSPPADLLLEKTTRFNALPDHLLILGVDDNEINRRVLKAMLNKLGHSVIEASSGQEAIDIVQSGVDIDLILMDCEMPGLNGFDTTKAIRRWQYGQADKVCRIIALTAHTLEEHKEHCLDAGMDGHLGKPLRLQELSELIDQLANELN